LLEETLSLVGELTGCGINALREARSGALEVFSTGFKNLEVSGIGIFTGVKVNAINFDQSPYLNTLPYSIDLLHYPSGGYEFAHGVNNPQSAYSYTENTNQTVSIQHEVSAQGISTSSTPGGNALDNAKNFVSGQITGAIPRPALINTTDPLSEFNVYLVDFSETVDKLNNTVGVSRRFETDPTDTINGGNVILRHTSQFSPTEGEEVLITYNGAINAGRPTGDATFQDDDLRMDAVRNRYSKFKDELDAARFITESITEDTGINLLSFSISYISGDQEPDGIIDDFTISLEENSDSSLFSVSVNGNLSTKGRCISEAFSQLSGYYDEPIASEGEQPYDHRYDLCQRLYREFYRASHGSCQEKPADYIALNRNSISKSVAYNEYAQSITYNASYNDRTALDNMHSFDYSMNFTPSLFGIKSVASAYKNPTTEEGGWIFEDLGYRKRASFSINISARPLSTITMTQAELSEFGEGKFQDMTSEPQDEKVTSNEYALNNQSVISATYAKTFHAGEAFVERGADCPNPDYTGIRVGGFNL
tara:strand:- start:4138 stop:5748 length:1611 start_codon:yes stop_codon:yes gene_type:complete